MAEIDINTEIRDYFERSEGEGTSYLIAAIAARSNDELIKLAIDLANKGEENLTGICLYYVTIRAEDKMIILGAALENRVMNNPQLDDPARTQLLNKAITLEQSRWTNRPLSLREIQFGCVSYIRSASDTRLFGNLFWCKGYTPQIFGPLRVYWPSQDATSGYLYLEK